MKFSDKFRKMSPAMIMMDLFRCDIPTGGHLLLLEIGTVYLVIGSCGSQSLNTVPISSNFLVLSQILLRSAGLVCVCSWRANMCSLPKGNAFAIMHSCSVCTLLTNIIHNIICMLHEYFTRFLLVNYSIMIMLTLCALCNIKPVYVCSLEINVCIRANTL